MEKVFPYRRSAAQGKRINLRKKFGFPATAAESFG